MKRILAEAGSSVSCAARQRHERHRRRRVSTRSSLGEHRPPAGSAPRWRKTDPAVALDACRRSRRAPAAAAPRAPPSRGRSRSPAPMPSSVLGVVVRRSRSRRAAARRSRRAARSARRPFSQWPSRQLSPSPQTSRVVGEGRIGPRVPGVDVDAVEIDHAPAVDGRDRVGAGDIAARASGSNASMKRPQEAALHEVVARPREKYGSAALGSSSDRRRRSAGWRPCRPPGSRAR